jgi:hypothetical protein
MRDTIRTGQEKTEPSSTLFPMYRSARLIILRGLPILILSGLLLGCAGRFINVPQPSRLTLTPETSMAITVADASYQEVVISLQLKKQLRKAHYYRLPLDKELDEYLLRTGQSIQDVWKDPRLAQGLDVDMVISPRIIEWKKDTSAPERKVYPDRHGVILYCSRISGTLRTTFTLWRTSDGVKLFEDEISSSRNTRECSPDLPETGYAPTTSVKTEEKAVLMKPGVSVPDPFLTGALEASWESDLFFESIVKKAVSSFVNIVDPSPFQRMFISVHDTMDYTSSRQLVKAKGYLRKGNWAEALTILEPIRDKYPDSYAMKYLIGIAQQGQLKLDAAKISFERAMELCQAKRDASSSGKTPDCAYIIKAHRNTLTWDPAVSPMDDPIEE